MATIVDSQVANFHCTSNVQGTIQFYVVCSVDLVGNVNSSVGTDSQLFSADRSIVPYLLAIFILDRIAGLCCNVTIQEYVSIDGYILGRLCLFCIKFTNMCSAVQSTIYCDVIVRLEVASLSDDNFITSCNGSTSAFKYQVSTWLNVNLVVTFCLVVNDSGFTSYPKSSALDALSSQIESAITLIVIFLTFFEVCCASNFIYTSSRNCWNLRHRGQTIKQCFISSARETTSSCVGRNLVVRYTCSK